MRLKSEPCSPILGWEPMVYVVGIKKDYNNTFLQINLSKFEVSIQNYKGIEK